MTSLPACAPVRLGDLRGHRERGAAVVLSVAVIGVLTAVTVAILVVAGAVTASHRARLAADLAALAGARRLQAAVSAESACREARRVASLNDAELRTCAVEGMDLEVTVVVPTSTWPSPANARAKAGPDRDSTFG